MEEGRRVTKAIRPTHCRLRRTAAEATGNVGICLAAALPTQGILVVPDTATSHLLTRMSIEFSKGIDYRFMK